MKLTFSFTLTKTTESYFTCPPGPQTSIVTYPRQSDLGFFLSCFGERFMPLLQFRFSYYTEGNSQTFKAKGSYTLTTGNVFDTEVKKDVQTGSVYAKGKADSGTFIDMMSSFGVNTNSLPDFFVDALK